MIFHLQMFKKILCLYKTLRWLATPGISYRCEELKGRGENECQSGVFLDWGEGEGARGHMEGGCDGEGERAGGRGCSSSPQSRRERKEKVK